MQLCDAINDKVCILRTTPQGRGYEGAPPPAGNPAGRYTHYQRNPSQNYSAPR